MTTMQEISDWFDRGIEEKAAYMIVVCDTFDHEDYPVYTSVGQFWAKFEAVNGLNMQRIMEVYDLSADKAEQLATGRNHRTPPRSV